MVKGRGTERKGSKDVSPCCHSGLSLRASITFIGWMLCCIRKWGGLCIRECGRTVSELRAL